MRISIIVPCRNEFGHIDEFLASAFAQSLPAAGDELEIVIADGNSDDGTRVRLDEWARRDARLVVIDNAARITSSALNLAIRQARGEIIVRMDVHTVYAGDYVRECVRALVETGAICVGGAWQPIGMQWPQRAIAIAFQSRFGSGGAASRRVGYSGPVDTVYLGAWRRDALLRLGGFDEFLVRNQDDELNLRITRGGGVVWQSAAIRSSYTPRGSFGALFRQFYQYGYWKVPVIRKHRLPASPRHLVPFGFVLAVFGLAVTGLAWAGAWWLLAALLLAYAGAAFANAVTLVKLSDAPRDVLGVVASFVCMHFGYGIGFARGLLDFVVLRRGPAQSMARLTR